MTFISILFLLALGLTIGKRLYPSESIVFYSGIGILTLISSLSIVGTIFYYIVGLPFFVIALMSTGLIITFLLLKRTFVAVLRDIRTFAADQVAWYRSRPKVEIIFALFVALFITIIAILARSPITDAVRSPWDRIPWIIFPLFFLLSCFGIYLVHAYRDNPSIKSTIRIIALLFFLIVSIGWIVFPIGYGFDSFIHQATEKLIAVEGVVTPKPLYYIGQYSLVVFLSKFLSVSIAWIDTLLVPILAALFIPWAIGHWWKRRVTRSGGPPFARSDSEHDGGTERQDPERAYSIFGILLLPFFLAQFTITTPQALANLLLVVLIFHIAYNTKHITNWLIALAILLVHPLAGIPAFILLLLRLIQSKKSYVFCVMCYVFAATAIPAAFLLIAQFSSSIHITWAPQNFLHWLQSIEWTGIYRENRFHAPWDLLYFYAFNAKNIFWFFIITGFISWWKNKKGVRCQVSGVRCFFILLVSYIFMAGFLSFNFLIGYEQTDYADRLLDIAYFFLIPFFLIGFDWWIDKILSAVVLETSPFPGPVPARPAFGPSPMRRGRWVRSAIAAGAPAVLALAMTASLYLTYPQNVDSYSVSRGFNTSQSDIAAVHWIEDNAGGEPYIVLANQAVSAAAIREFGFKKYYQCQSNVRCQMSDV
ncbi:hypothetical protein HY624_01360, partial [Candidatus Uhrbacteria bacterium]|nr:hypothetical protein [Candidatus Uhrbacteria bacterium]